MSKLPQESHSIIIAPDTPQPASPEDVFTAQIDHVHDGDGFVASLRNPHTHVWFPRFQFRFAFIDAPERGQAYGEEARSFLHSQIAGRTLRLDPIAKASMNGVPFDPYRRILCMGFLTEDIGAGRIHYYLNGQCGSGTVRNTRSVTRNIELEMIVNGWAWVMEQYSFEREEDYFAAQADAQRHRRGLWQMDNPEPPWIFKRRRKRQRLAAEQQESLI